MGQADAGNGRHFLFDQPVAVSAAFESSDEIAQARALARSFLSHVQAAHGLPVSEPARDVVELVVSELVTNARTYAPGPYLLTLELSGGAVEVTVWDSAPVLPTPMAPDPERVGRHGLEIVMALCRSLEVHREPVGKRIKVAVVLADDPGGDAAGHQLG
ncbi:ATP-binding protein [Streptomyces sp. NPDC002138]|uniref:ATP-binding protein n=1 Tax=Streptomyces sp. NPDC002138 TaxID=3154410 RepID=UPI003333AA22